MSRQRGGDVREVRKGTSTDAARHDLHLHFLVGQLLQRIGERFRRAALVEIYKTEEQAKKSEESKSRAIALAQQLVSQYPQSDWSARGQMLLYLLQQGVPAYGNVVQ